MLNVVLVFFVGAAGVFFYGPEKVGEKGEQKKSKLILYTECLQRLWGGGAMREVKKRGP